MNDVTELVRSTGFQARLRDGRGDAAVMMTYRGASRGPSGDDGRGGAASRLLDECLDEVEASMGTAITHANVFSSGPRCTMTVAFGMGTADADIVLYHDTLSGRTEYQVLHRSTVSVEFPSRSALLEAFADPWTMVGLHFPAPEHAEAVRTALRRVGMRPAPPADTRTEWETCAMALEPDGDG